jgi:hypothetical protein
VAITTLATAEAELQARGYSRFSTTRLDAWLNAAKNRFEDYPYDWPWLKTSATGAVPLTISDLRRVRSVVDSSTSLPLDQVDEDAIVEFASGDLTVAGSPSGWYLTSDTVLSTYPVTAGSVKVRYVKFSPELSSGSDTPLIPARYRMLWVDLAEVEALRFGVKDAASAAALEQGVFRRLGEVARVYAMQGQPAYMEMLMTGASVDG